MKKLTASFVGILGMMILVVLTGCAAPVSAPLVTVSVVTPTVSAEHVVPTATALLATSAQTFNDPFAYCSAVTTIDRPDASFTGDKMPEAVLDALMKLTDVSPDAKDWVRNGSIWRCMDGKVYACFVGANLPCGAKANVDKTPTAAEVDFCTTNPASDGIPAAVTGHETIYDWFCKDGKPAIRAEGFHVDARGYIAEIWYAIDAPK
jgi:hypothetical protein